MFISLHLGLSPRHAIHVKLNAKARLLDKLSINTAFTDIVCEQHYAKGLVYFGLRCCISSSTSQSYAALLAQSWNL